MDSRKAAGAMILAALLVAGPLAAAQSAATPAAAAAGFREARWEELMPKGWDPYARFRGMNLGLLSDTHPRVLQLMRELREILDNAPINPALAGASIRLPGYVVPLDQAKGELKEFLLVPYFGACIHTPPPPNQIVHVVLAKPAKGFLAMSAVWVSGVLDVRRNDSAMGVSGYAMQAAAVARHEPAVRP